MLKNVYDVIKRPVITEKSKIEEENNKYTFIVSKFANKILVKKAIKEIFGADVDKVNILNVYGKTKRFKGKMGQQSPYKKAVVTVTKNQVIDINGGVK